MARASTSSRESRKNSAIIKKRYFIFYPFPDHIGEGVCLLYLRYTNFAVDMEKSVYSFHFFIKALSVLLAFSYFFERLFLFGETDVLRCIAVALSCAGCVAILLPVGAESVKESFFFALPYAVFIVISSVFAREDMMTVMWSAVFVLIYLCFRLRGKYRHIRILFRNEEVWHGVEENARWTYVSMYFILCTFLCISISLDRMVPVASGGLLVFYIVMLLRSFFGSTFFISAQGEALIRNIIKGSMRPENAMTVEEEDMVRKGRLYEKVQSIMETKRPYLDEEFSLQDLATASFTNKTYLSKTINLFSGRNFRQFVNWYRVQYSIDLMNKDKHLRISELSMMSGFHTVVTYNMAFKLNMNETPSEYLQKLRLGLD